MNSILGRSFVVLLVILLSFSALAILKVKGQEELPALDIHVESPTSKTYSENTLLLNVSFYTHPEDQREYKIVYWITGENDNYSSKLFQGVISQSEPIWNSLILTEIPDGEYTLLVSGEYATGRWWIYAYETELTNFAINVETSTPEPSYPTPTPTSQPPPLRFSDPTTIILATIIILVIVGIFAYFKKYRKQIH